MCYWQLVLVPYLSGKFIESDSEYERNAFEYCRRQLLEYNPKINEFCKARACEIDWIGLQKCACEKKNPYCKPLGTTPWGSAWDLPILLSQHKIRILFW